MPSPPVRATATAVAPSPTDPISTDPLEEPQRTSALFLPFPSSLVSRLSPPAPPARPLFTGISPAPSESDVSERRYSDISSASLSSSTSASSSSRRLREWEVRARPCPPALPLAPRDRATVVRAGKPTEKAAVLGGVVSASGRNVVLADDGLASKSSPFIPLPGGRQPSSNRPRASVAAVDDGVRPMDDDRGKRRLRKVWRLLGGRGRKKEKEREGRRGNPEGKEWKGESMRRLRLRGERSARESSAAAPVSVVGVAASPVRRSVPPSASRDVAAARGHGRRTRSVAFAGTGTGTGSVGEIGYSPQGGMGSAGVDRVPVGESPSLGSVGYGYSPQRERVSFADVKREANSFAAYRGRMFFTAEGSSVSSSEDRDEDGAAPESGHLYLSRRQLRAMQYK